MNQLWRNMGGLRRKFSTLSTSNSSYVRTDLVEASLHGDSQIRVFFKLETQQSSGSFKDRGLFHLVKSSMSRESNPVTMLISSSGGNAGNAVATVGQRLDIPTRVFVPQSTMDLMVEKIKSKGADVTIHGENWNEADKEARKAVGNDPGALYCPPFDHPLIWEGASSIVDEIGMQLNRFQMQDFPDAIILSVGGGGLLRGVQLGLERNGYTRTKIIAVETKGAATFAAAPRRLEAINSVATSLGSLYVVPSTLDSNIDTISMVVSDTEAVEACYKYAEEHRTLVEPACGAALAALSPQREAELLEMGIKSVVVVVCGGSAVSIDLLQDYRRRAALSEG